MAEKAPTAVVQEAYDPGRLHALRIGISSYVGSILWC